MRKKFTMLLASLLCCVGVMKAEVTDLPELTTDPENPVYYTIKNVRGGVYAAFAGQAGKMVLGATVDNPAYLFYFTEGSSDGTYKIHNALSTQKCAAYNNWTADGIDWYIKESGNTEKPGYAISTTTDLTQKQSWNNESNRNQTIAYWDGHDLGSTWEFTKYEGDILTRSLIMSTTENPVLYYIKNVRVNKYANFVKPGTQFTETSATNLGSYWYFVEVEDADVPAGFVACYIYNAGSNVPVENPNVGYMAAPSATPYPAKVYYVGKYTCEHYNGYVIYPKGAGVDDRTAWNDLSGYAVTIWGYGDNGSSWNIYPAGKTVAELETEADNAISTLKNTWSPLWAVYEEADYYSFSSEAIATAKNVFETTDVTTDLAAKIVGYNTMEVALETLRAGEKSGAPVAGDYIRLKNRQRGGYLKSTETAFVGTEDASDLSTLWAVEAVEGSTNVRLRNVVTGHYIGKIEKAKDAVVATVDSENNQFVWENVADCYAAFKEITTNDAYSYGHMSNTSKLIGYNTPDIASHWIVTQQTVEEAMVDLENVLASTQAMYGTKVGQYALTEEMAAAQSAAQALVDEDPTDIVSILNAAKNLQAQDTKENLNLPEADKYYNIVSSCTKDHRAYQQVYVNANGGMQFARLQDNLASSMGYVFQFVPASDGKFYIYNVERGVYMESVGSAKETQVSNAKAVTISNMGSANIVSINPDGQSQMHAQDNGSKIVGWNENNYTDGSAWTIEEVDITEKSHPVAITDVEWATLMLGYDATVPEGVTAYAVSSVDGDVAKLTEVEGAIPAGEAVLLNGANGTYEFKFAESAGAVDGNMLEGSTINSYVTEDAYVLAATNGAGLYKAAMNQKEGTAFLNNAFKAYLPAPANASAPMFSFGRGEGTTGIDNAQLVNDNVVIYDLTGRRVQQMEKGIYIVNGKKVVK